MGIIVFVIATVVLVGGPLLWTLRPSRSKAPITTVVLLATAPNMGQAMDWRDQLVRGGIRAIIRSQGSGIVSLPEAEFRDVGIRGYVAQPPEIWVPAKDAERASMILKLSR